VRTRPAVLAALLLAPAGATWAETPDAGAEERFVALLCAGAAEAAGVEPVALAGEPGAVSGYLALASGHRLPTTPAGEPRPLTGAERDLLARVGPRLPGAEVVAQIRRTLGEDPDDAWRSAALGLLGVHARAADLGLLVDTVSEAGPSGESEGLLEDFRAAVIALVQRDPEVFEQLGFAGAVRADVAVEIVRAVGQAGEPRGLEWLCTCLGDVDLAAAALQEIGRLATRAAPARALAAAEQVRPLLWAEDPGQRRRAIGVLAVLNDVACLPRLIELLEESEGGERKAAHSALQDLSGCRFPDRGPTWRGWYQEEARWWDEESEAVMADLTSEDVATVQAAVRAASQRTLRRDRLALGLAPLVREHESPAVRSQACAGLARLGSELVLRDLADALDDEDPGVRAQALLALRKITGWDDLATDRSAWTEALRSSDDLGRKRAARGGS